jgi:hypothetical protein
MNPVKGVLPNSSASRDFKGGFKVELAQGVTRQMTKLMDEVRLAVLNIMRTLRLIRSSHYL